MNSMVTWVDKILAHVLILLMVAMVLTVSWQVASRYILNDPSSVTEEIARFLLIWIGLLGASYAYRARMHLGLDLLVAKLPRVARIRIEQLGFIAAIVFASAVMIVGGLHLVSLAWELNQLSAALGIRMAWVYLVLPISGSLIVFYAGYFLLNPPSRNLSQQGAR